MQIRKLLNESIANFIDFEVGVENPTNDPDDEVSEYSDSLKSFIDDDEDDAVGRSLKTLTYL